MNRFIQQNVVSCKRKQYQCNVGFQQHQQRYLGLFIQSNNRSFYAQSIVTSYNPERYQIPQHIRLQQQQRSIYCSRQPLHNHQYQQQHQYRQVLKNVCKPLSTHKAFSTTTIITSDSVASDIVIDNNNNSCYYDIVIVGGGVVGSSLARLLSIQQSTKQLSIAIIESGTGPSISSSTSTETTSTSTIPHPRSYALSPASMNLLGLQVPSPTTNEFTNNSTSSDERNNNNHNNAVSTNGYYTSMQIWESGQPSSLIFTHYDLPSTNEKQQHQQQVAVAVAEEQKQSSSSSLSSVPYLGCCIEDNVLQKYLWNEIVKNNTVHIYKSTIIDNVQTPNNINNNPNELIQITISNNNKNDTTTSTHENNHTNTIQTKLIVAADGANSLIRNKYTNINVINQFDYNQTALTFTVQFDEQQQQQLMKQKRAFQRFLSTGPIALLPTKSLQHGIIVWSTTVDDAQYWKNHPTTNLVQHINTLLQTGPELFPKPLLHESNTTVSSNLNNILYGIDKVIDTIQYGLSMAVQQGPLSAAAVTGDSTCAFTAPPTITNIVSDVLSFPLSSQQVSNYTDHNGCIVLIGDSAHTVHPMAGQGLNLGIQDASVLVQTITKAIDAGMDFRTFLSTTYELNRSIEVSTTINGIHTLQQLFVGSSYSQSIYFKHLKSFGMNTIQSISPLRQLLVQTACQGVGSTTNSTRTTTTKNTASNTGISNNTGSTTTSI